MKRIVIDASTSLKWVFEDEEDAKLALTLLTDVAEGKVDIIAPSIWLYEISNGIRSAVLRNRIKLAKGKKILSLILEVAPELLDFTPVVVKAFEAANEYNISVYDASYLVVAQEEKVDFYTGDKSLHRNLRQLKFVKLISQYKLS